MSVKWKIMPRSGASSSRNCSPRDCSAVVLATSAWMTVPLGSVTGKTGKFETGVDDRLPEQPARARNPIASVEISRIRESCGKARLMLTTRAEWERFLV